MEAKLIKIDRNGSKHYEGIVTCDRCGGDGIYKWGAMISWGGGAPMPQYAGVCFKCNGSGRVRSTWIERTPEYQAKLDAKRQAKLDAKLAEQEAKRQEEEARQEAERATREAAAKAEAERIAALKAVSQYVSEVGKRGTYAVTYDHYASFEVPSFKGYGTELMYVHTFKDADGNVLVWKTSNAMCGYEGGEKLTLTGTVKEHSEYRGEKQTVLTRCKIAN